MENTCEVARLEIAKLDLQEGDTLVVKTNGSLLPCEMKRIRNLLTPIVPKGVKVLVLGNDVELQVIGRK